MLKEVHKQVPKAWGYEVWLINTPQYCGKKLVVDKSWQCSLHYHKIKDETFHVLRGIVKFELDDETLTLECGDTVHVPPRARHRFTGVTNAIIVEFSTHHSDDDVVRIEPSKTT